VAIPFVRDFEAPYGEPVRASPSIRRVLARNPSAFTFKGTGVYILGQGDVAVVDPGPDDPDHIAALKRALAGERVAHILITHTHIDHSPAARALKAWSGATVYGYGPHGSGKIEEGVKVEEGGDLAFVPDVVVREGDTIEGVSYTIDCVYTPGHCSNHMCYALREERALFTGDHVMGWSTTVVAPPDGDMAAYMKSLDKLIARDDAVLWPTHGGPVRDPKPFLHAYREHRHAREAQIAACLADGIGRIPDMVARIYRDIDPRLHAAAGMSALAHLIQMVAEGRAVCDGVPSSRSIFRPV